MGKETAIEWTHHTFNPWWGCTKVSPGCLNCYAETFDHRLGGDHWGPGKPRRVFGEKHWNEPRRWNREAILAGARRRVFCASMADVFDAEAPPGALDRLWALIRETPNLDWQLLTKRPERIAASLPPDWGPHGYANVWLGTTVEDQKRAEERVQVLLEVPAVVRFLSCEPLLGPIDLRHLPYRSPATDEPTGAAGREWAFHALAGYGVNGQQRRIDWVIAGGESGPGARPMHPAWARALRDQCVAAGVAFLFKQWGEWAPTDPDVAPVCDESCRGKEHIQPDTGPALVRLGKKTAGRVLDGRTWDEFPTPRTVSA